MPPIRASIHCDGDAAPMLEQLRRLPSVFLERINLEIIVRIRGGAQRYEPYFLSSIRNGDGARAREDVARLAHQRRIDREMEEQVLNLIAEYERLTR